MATGVRENNGKCLIRWSYKGQRFSQQTEFPYTPVGIRKASNVRRHILKGMSERSPTKIPTFGELAQTRLDTASFTPSTRRMQKTYLNNYWREFFTWPVDSIQYADILHLTKVNRAPKTITHILSVGSGVFRLAVKSGYRSDNPALQLSAEVKIPKAEIDPFTAEERDAILKKLVGNHKLFYAIRFFCGLRPGEVICLQWEDYREGQFKIRRSRWRGHEGTTKTKKERTVPVHPVVRKMLQQAPRSLEGHILSTPLGKPYGSADHFTEPFVKAMEELGIRYRSPYNCRHTCATMMLEAGMKPGYCAKALGHSLQMFFSRYAGWIDRDEMERQARIWETI